MDGDVLILLKMIVFGEKCQKQYLQMKTWRWYTMFDDRRLKAYEAHQKNEYSLSIIKLRKLHAWRARRLLKVVQNTMRFANVGL